MKDARLVELRRRAVLDPRLSHAAARLIAVLVELIYPDRRYDGDDEFPMRWSTVARHVGIEKEDSFYRWVDEVETAGYLRRGAIKLSPPTRHYFFCFQSPKNGGIESPKNGGIESPKNGGIESPKNGGTDSPKNGGHLISNPFRKESESQRESIGSLRSTPEGEGGNGSLRSREERGKTDGATLKRLFAAMKASANPGGLPATGHPPPKARPAKTKTALSEAKPDTVPATAKPPAVRKPRKGS